MNSKKLIIPLLSVIMFAFVLIPSAKATESEDVCLLRFPFLPDTNNFCLSSFAFGDIDVGRTIIDIIVALVNRAVPFVLLQRGPDELGTCAVYNFVGDNENPGLLTTYSGMSVGEANAFVSDLLTGTDQNSLALLTPEAYIAALQAGESLDCNLDATFWERGVDNPDARRNAGSLAGITKSVEAYALHEPPPVSLAYYLQHNAQKIPGLQNTAFAATTYPVWGLDLALSMWETSRNIAFGMISVFMLVIGIMIITRKRINPQAVVTIQTALPRVIISLILITFSYPIGATLMSFMFPLTILVVRALLGFGWEDINDNITGFLDTGFINLNAWNTITHMVSFGLALGQGLVVALIVPFLGIFTIGITLWAIIKAIFIQLKLIIAIIIAPIQFAIAAIPGNENLIATWFKSFIAKVLAVPAMMLMLAVAWYFLVIPFTDAVLFAAAIGTGPNVGPGVLDIISVPGFRFFVGTVSKAMSIVMLPLMTILIASMAIGAPKKIEEFIMGESAGGGKRRK